MQARVRTAIALVSLTLVAVACGGGAATSATTEASVAPGAIPEILDFEAPLLDGGVLRGADLAGKDVAFWFWAPW